MHGWRLSRAVFAAALACLALGALLAGGSRAAVPPRPVLWVWERATDLTFLDPARADVAFLSQTLVVRDGRVTVVPRQQPLRVAPGTAVIPVTRVEPAGLDPERATPELTAEMAQAVVATAAHWVTRPVPDEVPRVAPRIAPRVVQIDFEARGSQRAFYRSLLVEVRRRLPPDVGLSITALASWCLDDPWLDGVAVSEVVPMLFRMGPDAGAVLARLEALGDFPRRACRSGVGVAVEEGMRWMPRDRRAWIFSATGWTPAVVARALSHASPERVAAAR